MNPSGNGVGNINRVVVVLVVVVVVVISME